MKINYNPRKLMELAIAVMRQTASEIEAERALVEANRKLVEANRDLIARMEKKMQAKLAEIWGEEERAKA